MKLLNRRMVTAYLLIACGRGALKTIAPSTECRKAFNHDPARFDSFVAQYTQELNNNPDTSQFIKDLTATSASRITLLYSDKDTRYNNAVVLKDWLQRKLG